MKVNKENERFFINLLSEGKLSVYEDGRVFNPTTQNWIGYTTLKGYICVGYKDGNRSRKCLVHRLVWLNFRGPIEDDLQINHKDGNKANNNLENLELVTESENHIHAIRNGLWVATDRLRESSAVNGRKQKGENNRLAKLTNQEALEIRQRYTDEDISQRELGEIYHVSRSCIKDVLSRRHFNF